MMSRLRGRGRGRAWWGFELEVTLLSNVNWKLHAEPVFHLGCRQQTCKILELIRFENSPFMVGRIRVEFVYHPEYVRLRERAIVRSHRVTQAIGKVKKLLKRRANLMPRVVKPKTK